MTSDQDGQDDGDLDRNVKEHIEGDGDGEENAMMMKMAMVKIMMKRMAMVKNNWKEVAMAKILLHQIKILLSIFKFHRSDDQERKL